MWQVALLFVIVIITGVVTCVRWLANGGKSTRAKIADDIEKLAADSAYAGKAAVFLEISQFVRKGTHPQIAFEIKTPEPTPVAQEPGGVLQEGASQDVASPVIASNVMSQAFPAKPATPNTGLNLDLESAFKSIDNINMLLYLGAFLVIVAASIFVGFNYETLSGVSKTFLLAMFAVVFYGAGLILYLAVPKLKPAGTTFTAIGLILMPIVGLAAHNLMFNGAYGSTIWFVTSIVCFALYFLSVAVLRKVYVAYFMAFATLSLIESGVSVFSLPVYYLAWGMVMTSIMLLLVAKIRGIWAEVADSFSVSAQLFVPIALLMSVVYVGENGLSQTGITIVLSSAFYAALSYISSKVQDQINYFGAAAGLFPLGLGIWLYGQSVPNTGLSFIMVGIGVVYLIGAELSAMYLRDMRTELLTLFSGAVGLVAALLVHDHPTTLAAILGGVLILNTYAAVRHKFATSLAVAVLTVLWLPYVLTRQVIVPAASEELMSFVYLFVAFGLIGVRTLVQTWADQPRDVARVAYMAAMALSIFWALAGANWAGVVIALILAITAVGLSYLEEAPPILLASAVLTYIASYELYDLIGRGGIVYVFLGAGALLYALSYLFTDSERKQILSYAGIAGAYMGAASDLTTEHLAPIGSLAVGGALSYVEAHRLGNKLAKYVSFAVLVAALEWLYLYFGLENIQYFTVTWAAYFAVLAYRYHADGDEQNRDVLTATSLAFLTLPLMMQSFGLDGQFYGLALTFESLVLVFLGIGLRYQLVRNWGAVVLVVEVLYQLRGFFITIPWYVVFGLLGLVLLGTALYLLARRTDQP